MKIIMWVQNTYHRSAKRGRNWLRWMAIITQLGTDGRGTIAQNSLEVSRWILLKNRKLYITYSAAAIQETACLDWTQ